MSLDPVWQAVAADDEGAVQAMLERQGRSVARQRTLGWSERYDGQAGEPSVTRAMGSATRQAVQSGLHAALVAR
jgi:hypothetical protein